MLVWKENQMECQQKAAKKFFRSGVRINKLRPEQRVTIHTESGSEYHMHVIDPENSQVLITGGYFRTEHEEAVVQGSKLLSSLLLSGQINKDMQLELTVRRADGRPRTVTTTLITRIFIDDKEYLGQ
jgi:hypothetical protein